MFIPDELKPEHSGHPGFSSYGCPCQYTVTPAFGRSTSSHGFGCYAKNGHCNPDEDCPSRIEKYQERLQQDEMLEDLVRQRENLIDLKIRIGRKDARYRPRKGKTI